MASPIVEFHWFTDPWYEMQAELKIASDRATMYGLRAVGRAVRAAARAQAPVYKGDDSRVVPGDLKRSIKSSRRITKLGGGTYQMAVMPVGNKEKVSKKGKVTRGTAVTRAAGPSTRGGGRQGARGVPLYRRQMEEKYGYMRAGMAVAEADAVRIFEDAYKIAFEKYAP